MLPSAIVARARSSTSCLRKLFIHQRKKPTRRKGKANSTSMFRLRRRISLRFDMKTANFILLILLVAGCNNNIQAINGKHGRQNQASMEPHRDFGNIKKHQNCNAPTRKELNESERCAIDLWKKNCTRASDCLITCTSSPDGEKIGGGCFHICFSPATGLKWEDQPDVDYEKCGPSRK